MNRGAGAIIFATLAATAAVSCKKGGDAPAPGDGGATDGAVEAMAVPCPAVDGATTAENDGGTVTGTDEFGFNAPEAKMASSLGRVNVFEVTTPVVLQRADIYLRADLPHTRLTIAIQEASSRMGAFTKLMDVQIDIGTCEGWASTGPLAIPLKVGRFYALGYDPNQPVIPFVSTDGDSLPIDGMFGRLIGSRTATSVSVPTLTWEKFLDKEYNRQRIVTAPRAADSISDAGAGGDAAAADAGTTDAGAERTTDGGAGQVNASDAARAG